MNKSLPVINNDESMDPGKKLWLKSVMSWAIALAVLLVGDVDGFTIVVAIGIPGCWLGSWGFRGFLGELRPPSGDRAHISCNNSCWVCPNLCAP